MEKSSLEDSPAIGDFRAGASLQGSYTLPVIPRLLPSDIVEGEHFVIVDLRRLISSSARPSGDPVVEPSSRVQGAGHTSGSSTSLSEDSSSSHPSPSRRTRSSHPEQLPLPDRVAGSAP